MPHTDMRLLARPLYLQVRDVLVERILEGNWKPGATLPNETSLAQQMGISIGTVRKALDLMETERIVTRRQGRGTFVNDYSQHPLLFSSFVGRDGKTLIADKRPKSVVRGTASQEIASRLGIRVNEEILTVDRIRYHNGRPFLTERCNLPVRLFRALPENIGAYQMSALAQGNGIIVGTAEESVTSQPASAADAADLDIPEGTPVLAIDRVIFSDRGDALEWRVGRAYLRQERFVVRYD
jgi:GntR family transcriptional regulator